MLPKTTESDRMKSSILRGCELKTNMRCAKPEAGSPTTTSATLENFLNLELVFASFQAL